MAALHRENKVLWIIGINLFLVCCIAAVFIHSTISYRRKLEQQNTDDITNINMPIAPDSPPYTPPRRSDASTQKALPT